MPKKKSHPFRDLYPDNWQGAPGWCADCDEEENHPNHTRRWILGMLPDWSGVKRTEFETLSAVVSTSALNGVLTSFGSPAEQLAPRVDVWTERSFRRYLTRCDICQTWRWVAYYHEVYLDMASDHGGWRYGCAVCVAELEILHNNQ